MTLRWKWTLKLYVLHFYGNYETKEMPVENRMIGRQRHTTLHRVSLTTAGVPTYDPHMVDIHRIEHPPPTAGALMNSPALFMLKRDSCIRQAFPNFLFRPPSPPATPPV